MKNSKGMIFLFIGLASLALIIAVAYFFFWREQSAAKLLAAPATVALPAVPDANTPLPPTFDPVEWSRNPQGSPTNGLTPTDPAKTPADTPSGFVVTMPEENPAGSTTLPAKPEAKSPAETLQSTGTVAFPETTKTSVAKPVAKAPAKATPKAATKAAKTVTITEYWLQVGAFKDRYQADAVSKTLENQGLKGTMTTVTVNGLTVVRVRVGPYTNQDEAKKFLAWVKPVKGLEESYITAVKATRTE